MEHHMFQERRSSMKSKFLLFIALFSLSSCEIISISEKSSLNDESNSSLNSDISISEIELSDNYSESISLENSENLSSQQESSSGIIDVSEKEYYKSLVDRNKIHYSNKHINDSSESLSQLEIFEINDTHGAFYSESSISGIAKVATCIKENTYNINDVIKIASGDLMQGTAFSNMLLGEPAVAALNEMNFDCFVIGFNEGAKGTKNEGLVGSINFGIYLLDENNNGFLINALASATLCAWPIDICFALRDKQCLISNSRAILLTCSTISSFLTPLIFKG